MSRDLKPVYSAITYALIGIGLGVMMRGIRFDDPFITYRFSENLARGLGFTYNPGAPEQALLTTAPLYALLLALPGAIGIDIPMASYFIGIAGLVVGAWALFMLGWQRGFDSTGFSAGLLLLIFPLIWLTIGFETPLFIGVTLLAFYCVAARRPVAAGLLAGAALGLRGDGLIVLGLCAAYALIDDWRDKADSRRSIRTSALVRVCGSALLIYLPLAMFLTAQFGSPIPTTLATKSAQAAAGLTGFYPNTSYPEGALILTQAYLLQTPLFVVVPIAIGLGIYRMIQLALSSARRHGLGWVRRVPFVLPVAWAALHFAGYTAIGVAPYVWYYAPMVPGIVCLMALGVNLVTSLFPRRAVAVQAGLTVLILPLLIGDLNIARVLRGGTPPPPSEVASKALPETKVDIYERAGRWLRDNTPAGATVGVTELGVMGYYAGREMTDFLGLTTPSRLGAIRRGDFVGGLVRSQPDYLALTSINSLYDANPQEDDWFRAIYTPVHTLSDARFWGTPMTIWQRTTEPITASVIVDERAHDLGGGWQVTGVAVSAREVMTDSPLIVSVRLKAGEPGGNRELRIQPIVVQRGDGLPVRSRVIHTDQYRPGEEAWIDFPILPYPDARTGAYDISIKWLDSDQEVVAGRIKVPLGLAADPDAPTRALSQGIAVEALAAPLSACAGGAITVTPTWRGGDPTGIDFSSFVELRDAAGAVLARHESQPRNGSYPTSVWSPGEAVPDPHPIEIPAAARGTFDIVVGLVNPADGSRLPVGPSAERIDDTVRIGALQIEPCPRE